MSSPRRERGGQLWSEFQSVFSAFAGVSIQTFDERGRALQPPPPLPSLCAYFQQFPETSAACQKDCFRKATSCRETRKILAARCYAGLSYRIVPVRKHNKPHAIILVGRVLNEVLGGEQCLGFIERYRLSRQSFLESLSGVRSLSAADLERVAAFVQRLAFSFAATDSRLEQRHALLERYRHLLDMARQVVVSPDRSPDQSRRMLEQLGQLLPLSGVAVLLAGEEGEPARVQASIGLGEAALHALAHYAWPRTFELHGQRQFLRLNDQPALLRAGLEPVKPPLVAQRLTNGRLTLGYLVMSGAALSERELDLAATASALISARVVHALYLEEAERKDQEARLLGQMAERCLTARTVEELLPLALEAAMQSLHASRGSILLAEEKGRIVACALRGVHAPISGTISTLRPGSVSHEVFFNKRPLLVRDTDRSFGRNGERQFPYASRSFVSVPLRDNGQALGVLQLTEREEEKVFTPGDLSLLERLSLQVSGAIRKARLEEEVKELRVTSSTDHLTGVHNRRFLEEQLTIELKRARRFGQSLAVAMLDLDDFKALNDEMGHEYGDRVLRKIAGTIRQQLRSVDVLARYGGDEFVLLLPGTGATGALNTVEKIRSRIASVELPGGEKTAPRRTFSVSAGLAVYPDTAATADELLRQSDQALYQAKKAGRNAALLWIG
jgi:diguanylate cyclase (GGDEF)-like protein